MPVYAAPALTDYVRDIWTELGVPPADAATVARVLVEANLEGHDSHGVIRLAQWHEHLQDGRLKPGAPLEVVHELPATATVDGGWNFGALAAQRAMEVAICKAQQVGVASVGLRRSHHIGRLGDYAKQAAAAGCVGQIMANNHGIAAAVAPWGGCRPRLATNPIAYGLPRRDAAPIIVDVTTSVAPEGKVRVLRNLGRPTPPDWLLDNQGHPTRDPNDFYADPRGALLPLGGMMGHKGYGLGIAVDIVGGALSGGFCTRLDPPPVYGNAAMFTVWSVEAIAPEGNYWDEVEGLVASLRSCPRREGVEAILLPGEPEQRTRAQRLAEGITIDPATWSQVAVVAAAAGVDPPAALSD